MASCVALLVAQASVAGPPRASLAIGATVVSPCSVNSTGKASAKGDQPVSIACANSRRAEVRTPLPEKPSDLAPESSDPVAVDKTSDLRVVEVFF